MCWYQHLHLILPSNWHLKMSNQTQTHTHWIAHTHTHRHTYSVFCWMMSTFCPIAQSLSGMWRRKRSRADGGMTVQRTEMMERTGDCGVSGLIDSPCVCSQVHWGWKMEQTVQLGQNSHNTISIWFQRVMWHVVQGNSRMFCRVLWEVYFPCSVW